MPAEDKEKLVEDLYVGRRADGSAGLGLLRHDPGARESWRRNRTFHTFKLEANLAEAAESSEGSIAFMKCVMELDEEGRWFMAANPNNQNLVTVLRHCYEDAEMRQELLQASGLANVRGALCRMIGAGHLWAMDLIKDEDPIVVRGHEMSGAFLKALPNIGLERVRFTGGLRISRDSEDAWNDLLLAYPDRDLLFRTYNENGVKKRCFRWGKVVLIDVRNVPDSIEEFYAPVRISFDPGLDDETYVRRLEEIKAKQEQAQDDLSLVVHADKLGTMGEEPFRRAAELLTGDDEIAGDCTALIKAGRVSYLDDSLEAGGTLCQRVFTDAMHKGQNLDEAELYSLDRSMGSGKAGSGLEHRNPGGWSLLMKMIKVARDPQVYRLAVRNSIPDDVNIRELHWALTQTKSLGEFMRLQSSGLYRDKLIPYLSLRVVINKHPDTARRILGEAGFTKDEIAELVGRKNQNVPFMDAVDTIVAKRDNRSPQ